MIFQVEIPKRGPICAKGGEPFEPGLDYYSQLLEDDNAGSLQRLDYCKQCWEEISRTKGGRRAATSWRSSVPAAKGLSDLPKKRDDRALYLLKEALNSQSPDQVPEAFVLSLYLARRRLITLRHEMKSDARGPLSIYEVADTEEMLCVPKLALSELQVEKLQLELAKKFKGT